MILIALGANLPGRCGPPPATLAAAKEAMEKRGIRVLRSSATYLTAPVPASDQPWYHNAVVHVETDLSPLRLLEALQEIESDLGRVRGARNAARIIDLDLLAYNDEILDRPELIVPHPRMHERAFVLTPLRDIAPDWAHPVLGETVSGLLENMDNNGVIPTEALRSRA